MSVVGTGVALATTGPVGALATAATGIHISFAPSSASTAAGPVDQLVTMLDKGNLGAYAILKGFALYHGGVQSERAVWQAGVAKMDAAHPTAEAEAAAAYNTDPNNMLSAFGASQAGIASITAAPQWAAEHAKPASWAAAGGATNDIGQVPPAPAPSLTERLTEAGESALQAGLTDIGLQTGVPQQVKQIGVDAGTKQATKILVWVMGVGLLVAIVYELASGSKRKKAAA